MSSQTNIDLQHFLETKKELTRFLMTYKCAMDEIETKINVLKQEFQHIHEYNPIEHVSSRLKSPESIIQKMYRKHEKIVSIDELKENIKDIAGVRIICSFISDIYRISDMIQKQKDVELVSLKDYIKNPKPNGYRSLHLILKIPVFMSDREEHVYVELQIRTMAMDFWASLEHKIYYKYQNDIPNHMLEELKEAASTASELDKKMEKLHKEIGKIKEDSKQQLKIDNQMMNVPTELVNMILAQKNKL
ncbi:MAG: GTP pyrophosphokinase family protein [Bacillus sp. (in: firmicutes)]